MDERIKTLHPSGKKGVNINRAKYNQVRKAIVDVINWHGELTFQELMRKVAEKLTGNFDGAIGWYTTTVKLDLEARGVIERVPGAKPQKLRMLEE